MKNRNEIIDKLNSKLLNVYPIDEAVFKLSQYEDTIVLHKNGDWRYIATFLNENNDVQINSLNNFFTEKIEGNDYTIQEFIELVNKQLNSEISLQHNEEYFLYLLTDIGTELTGKNGLSGWNDITNIEYVKELEGKSPIDRVITSIRGVANAYMETCDYNEVVETFGIMQEFYNKLEIPHDVDYVKNIYAQITEDIMSDFLDHDSESIAKEIQLVQNNAYYDIFLSELKNAFVTYHDNRGLDVSNVSVVDVFDFTSGISFWTEFKFIDESTSLHFLDVKNWQSQVEAKTLMYHLEWLIEEGGMNIEQYTDEYKLLGEVYNVVNDENIKPYFTGTEEYILTNISVKTDSIQLTYLEKNCHEKDRYDEYVTSLSYDVIVQVQEQIENPKFMDYIMETDFMFNNVIFKNKELDGTHSMTSKDLNNIIETAFELNSEMEME